MQQQLWPPPPLCVCVCVCARARVRVRAHARVHVRACVCAHLAILPINSWLVHAFCVGKGKNTGRLSVSKECVGNIRQLLSYFAEIVVVHTQNNCWTSHSEALSFLSIFIIA